MTRSADATEPHTGRRLKISAIYDFDGPKTRHVAL